MARHGSRSHAAASFDANTWNMGEYMTPESLRYLVKVIGRDDPGEVLGTAQSFGGRKWNLEPLAVRFPLDGLCAFYDEEMVKPWAEGS